jgi:hypothetical protein
LSANALMQFNQLPAEEQTNQTEEQQLTDDKKDDTQNHESSQISQNQSQRKARDFQTATTDGTQELDPKTIKECEPIFFNIIETIFRQGCPKATCKIGLIYLAKIINYYPDFTKQYLDVLLTSPENIRLATLEIKPLPGTEEEVYVSGANTEKYRTYGAPMEWNSLYISQQLQETVIQQECEVLEQSHIEIFDAAIGQ